MPSLRSHIIIAEEILNSLESKELQSLIREELPLYYLGAIFPDIFYYNLRGELLALGDLLHDSQRPNSEKTIKRMFEEITTLPCCDKEKSVFVFGLLTHIAAEQIFHPAVYYFTGNADDPNPKEKTLSVAAHRHFEMLLDLCLMKIMNKKLKDLDLAKLFKSPRQKRDRIFRFFAANLAGASGTAEEKVFKTINKAYAVLLVLNRLFCNGFCYYLMKAFNVLSRRRLDPYFRLFYPPRIITWHAIFDSYFSYKNPITGQEAVTSMWQLKEEARAFGASVLNKAYEYIFRREEAVVFYGTIYKYLSVGEMKYFYKIRFHEKMEM